VSALSPVAALDAYADAGPLARLAGRAEPQRDGQAFGLTVLGVVPLVVALVLLDPDLFDRLLLLAAVLVFAVAASLGWAGSLGGRYDWLVPALLRAVEYGVVIRVTAVLAPDATPAAFAFCAVLAYHHYDAVNRVRHTGAPPARWVSYAGGGFDARMVAVALLALGGADALADGLWVLAVSLGVVFVAESVATWVAVSRKGARGGVAVPEDEEVA
jgi:hypothetical protein